VDARLGSESLAGSPDQVIVSVGLYVAVTIGHERMRDLRLTQRVRSGYDLAVDEI